MITELPRDWENRILEGTNLVHTRTQEKRAVAPQETEPDLPVSVQESPVEVWIRSGLMQDQRH